MSEFLSTLPWWFLPFIGVLAALLCTLSLVAYGEGFSAGQHAAELIAAP